MAKVRKADASIDRKVITGMIVSTKYLKAVVTMYSPQLLLTPFSRTVAGWCLDYLERYGEAPYRHIEDIFHAKERAGLPETQVEEIAQFLESISEEFERTEAKFNDEFLLHETEIAFRARALKCLTEDVQAYLSNGDLLEAEGTLSRFRIPERMKISGGPFNDRDALQRAFESREAPLFKLPGAIGHLMNPHFVRGGFVALLGREKIGKTFLMSELSLYALKDKCNVAMFQIGDLTEEEYRIRQSIRVAGRSNQRRYCDDMHIPVLDCYNNQNASCELGKSKNNNSYYDAEGVVNKEELINACDSGKHQVCTKCYRKNMLKFQGALAYKKRPATEPLDWREAFKAMEDYERKLRLGRFKLTVHPSYSVNVKSIENQLDIWYDQDGFMPDVIFIDYADIMASDDSRKEDRAAENLRWGLLRGLTQTRKILLITATQGNRMGYDVEVMQGKHVSEDKRKLSHVTAFFSLNQTPKEKRSRILRVAPILEGIREGHSELEQQVNVIQCLEIGNPIISSFYHHKVKKGGGKND